MVYSRRLRAQVLAEREASGEDLWTTSFDIRARRRLGAAFLTVRDRERSKKGYEVASSAASLMTEQGGWPMGDFLEESHIADVNDQRGTEWTLDALDCIYMALQTQRGNWQEHVNLVLNEHRIAFRMVEGQIIAMSSDQLQQEVVEPTLRLLIDSRFDSAHAAYLKALEEITNNDAGDAITDAATALQETLIALGCVGNSLGPLMKNAKQQGLLGSHDQGLIDGIGRFVDWASADRSTTGDAHSHSNAVVADAWLMVHVVGALIVRLADVSRRGDPSD